MNNDFYQRQHKLMQEILEQIKKTNDPEYLNLFLNDFYALLNFFEDLDSLTEWYQQMMDNWGMLEIINSMMLAENRSVWTEGDKKLRDEAIIKMERLLYDIKPLLNKI